MSTILTETYLDAALDKVWDFHRDPQNLVKMMPHFFQLKLRDVPDKIEKGSQFTILSEAPIMKAFFNWRVEYTDWFEDGNLKFFVDEQKSGPFSFWKHRHEFRSSASELSSPSAKAFHPKVVGAWVKDEVDYEIRRELRFAAPLIHRALLRMFSYRKKKLNELFSLTRH